MQSDGLNTLPFILTQHLYKILSNTLIEQSPQNVSTKVFMLTSSQVTFLWYKASLMINISFSWKVKGENLLPNC